MNDMILSSLLGTNIIKEAPSFEAMENKVEIKNSSNDLQLPVNKVRNRILPVYQFFPLTLSVDGGPKFTLPYEPQITIEGKNSIVKRKVLKYNEKFSGSTYGSVKERWSTDDYSITIEGAIFGELEIGLYEMTFPRREFEQLKYFLLQGKEIKVSSPPLELLGISHIAIEEFSFPFIQGENVLAYKIKALSDVPQKLFVE
jgi:hypothetical protein